MKAWKKIIAMIALVASLGLICYTVLIGWGGGHRGSAENITLGLDLAGGVSITYRAVGDISSQDLSDTVYKMQQRLGNYDGAQVYSEGTDRVTIEIPGADDAEAVLEELGKPGSLYFILQYAEDGKTANYEYGQYKNADGKDAYGWHLTRSIEDLQKDGSIVLTGEDIKDCQGTYEGESDSTKEPVVAFELTKDGAEKFKVATGKAVEPTKHWSIGVYYDGEFVSVPTVTNQITNGSGVINGMDSLDEAKNVASYIRIGALPVELEEISSKVVGATLGQEAIHTSVIAGLIGFALLFIFMIAYYRIPGIAANIALVVYTGAMLLILNVFDLTLTLPGIAGIDTRALTKILREKGTMNGMITVNENYDLDEIIPRLKAYTTGKVVEKVTCKEKEVLKGNGPKVALMDFGAKRNIARSLNERGCQVTIYPALTPAEEILKDAPDGIMLSNGPGDPKECTTIIEEIRKLYESDVPIFAICLGHQLMALATGGDTHKMKYGHRGGNHPVKDLETGRVYISSQNHGYVVDAEGLEKKGIAKPAFINVNDGTNEGMAYEGKNIFTVQFHPEACPGPQDSSYLFDRFMKMMGGTDHAEK